MKSYLLGIDIGTSSVKSVIIDENATVVDSSSATYRFLAGPPIYRQIDSDSLWHAILDSIRQLSLKNSLSYVKGIGISCLCPGLSAIGEDGKVLVHPIIYSDQRSALEAEYLKSKIPESYLFGITANTVMPGSMSSTSMLWIKNNHPDLYEKTYCFGHINTLVGYWLTGKYGVDRSNASYTLLFDTVTTLEWSGALSKQVGIPLSKLPPLFRSSDILGELTRKEIIDMGIPYGTPVVMGGGDTACASLASGIVNDGDVSESCGTTDVLTVCTAKPVFRREFINRCHVVEGKWIYQGAMSHIGSSLTWIKDLLSKAAETSSFDSVIQDAISKSVPGANGVVFLPYMMGERSPVWDSYARGVFFGMSLSTTENDLVRAVLEAPGYGLLQMIHLAEEITNRRITSFPAIGGGAASPHWMQIKADISGKTINTLSIQNPAAVGAAILAGIGSSVFSNIYEAVNLMKQEPKESFHPTNNRELSDVYNKRYQTYIQLYPNLKQLFFESFSEA